MKLNKKFATMSLSLASVLVLAACGGASETEENVSEAVSEVASEASSAVSEATSSNEVESSSVAEGELQDGTYTLVEKNLDENGWKVDFTMTVAGGQITESNFDAVDESGAKKSEDEEYQAAMSEKVGIGPQEYMEQLNSQLVETQDASQVEVVSGATHSSESFKEYAQMLIDAAKEGNTETIEIDN